MNVQHIDEENFYNLIQNKRVIIFGASYMAQEAIRYYQLKNQVDFLVDNDPKKWDTCFDVNGNEVYVKSPEVLKNYSNNSMYILLIANKFYSEIIEQLNELSFLDNMKCYVFPLMKKESYNILLNNPKINCSGCYACLNICPKKCIEMVNDNEGFPFPQIDCNRCNNCGLCTKVCPIKNPLKSETDKDDWEIYAAWSLDDNIRLSSSSGGIFSELALSILSEGGYVCGARFKENLTVEHCIVDNIKDLEKLRHSKYMQSDIGWIYNNIRTLLDNNKKVMFCGTPCQSAALIKFLGKKYDNLLNCSLLCGGYNSPKAFLNHIDSIEKKYSSKVINICFRNKKLGWDRFSVKINFENEEKYFEYKDDPFINGYIHYSLFCRLSCYDCKYVGENRPYDITLADFWNIEKSNPFLPTKKGVSLVMCHTNVGKDYFKKIKHRLYTEEHTFNDATQHTLVKSVNYNFRRNLVMSQIDKEPFEILVNKFLK